MHILRGWWQFRLYRVFAILEMVLFHDEFHSCPVVLFPMMYELHSQTLRFFADKRNILYIESTHKYFRTRMHTGGIMGKVCQKNIPVNVGNNHIKRFAPFQQIGVTQFHCNVMDMVQCNVVFELLTHQSSMSMAVTGLAPRMEARMARIEVPHPISRTDFPFRSASNSSLIIELVVS